MSEEEADSVSVSFDLADYLPDGAICLGFIGAAKFIDPEGRENVAYLEGGLKHWERLGILEHVNSIVGHKTDALVLRTLQSMGVVDADEGDEESGDE